MGQLKLPNSFLMWVRAAAFTCLCLITPRLLLKCLLHKLSLMNRNRKVKHRAADSGERGFLPARGGLALRAGFATGEPGFWESGWDFHQQCVA